MLIEAWGALIAQGEQADYLDSAGFQLGGAAQHLLRIAALVQVGYQDEDSLRGA